MPARVPTRCLIVRAERLLLRAGQSRGHLIRGRPTPEPARTIGFRLVGPTPRRSPHKARRGVERRNPKSNSAYLAWMSADAIQFASRRNERSKQRNDQHGCWNRRAGSRFLAGKSPRGAPLVLSHPRGRPEGTAVAQRGRSADTDVSHGPSATRFVNASSLRAQAVRCARIAARSSFRKGLVSLGRLGSSPSRSA